MSAPNLQRIDSSQGRFYRIHLDGRTLTLPSVTSILGSVSKDWLAPWAVKQTVEAIRTRLPLGSELTPDMVEAVLAEGKREHRRVVAKACAFGSAAHAAIERLLQEDESAVLSQVDPTVRDCVDSFRAFWQEHGLQCIHSERIVWSEAGGFAGTLDCLARDVHGRLVLFDCKTSNHHDPLAELQVVAYGRAVAEMDGAHPDCLWIVRLPKRGGTVELVEVAPGDWLEMFDTFQAARRLHEWKLQAARSNGTCTASRRQTRRGPP